MQKTAKILLLSPTATTVLKGLAIVAVIAIHYFSLLKPSPFWNNSTWQTSAVLTDRLARLSVPLFVALSGYGLSQKYRLGLKGGEFVRNRLLKLLPWYLGWSVFYFLFALVFYHWQMASSLNDFLMLLVLGRVDYHLYFVPMIFQLYLLFPILFWSWKRWPRLTLGAALLGQITWLWFFSYQGLAPFNSQYFVGDVEQYFWSPNWLWYFVLGFQLPMIITWISRQKLLVKSLLLVAGGGGWLALSFYSLQQLQAGINALNVLRFTQYPVMVFATLGIILLTWQAARIKRFPAALVWLGKYSYQIYLSHYLWLRLLFQLVVA